MKRFQSLACPQCGHQENKVCNKRNFTLEIYRRRECLKCGHRFATYEVLRARVRLSLAEKTCPA